jgi:hypothetical protein
MTRAPPFVNLPVLERHRRRMRHELESDGSEPMTVAEDLTTVAAVPEPATVARFDPMLRALISFGLVERDPDVEAEGVPGWRLIPAVQSRLESLHLPLVPAEKLIYFGHRCRSCGEHGPTRMWAGVFLCESCRRAAEERQDRLDAQGA